MVSSRRARNPRPFTPRVRNLGSYPTVARLLILKCFSAVATGTAVAPALPRRNAHATQPADAQSSPDGREAVALLPPPRGVPIPRVRGPGLLRGGARRPPRGLQRELRLRCPGP